MKNMLWFIIKVVANTHGALMEQAFPKHFT